MRNGVLDPSGTGNELRRDRFRTEVRKRGRGKIVHLVIGERAIVRDCDGDVNREELALPLSRDHTMLEAKVMPRDPSCLLLAAVANSGRLVVGNRAAGDGIDHTSVVCPALGQNNGTCVAVRESHTHIMASF